jgi:hypothetical protein
MRETDNVIAIGEPIVSAMRYLQDLTTLQDSTACYGDSFTFSYVDVCTSQEAYLCPPPTVCYGDSFSFFICR